MIKETDQKNKCKECGRKLDTYFDPDTSTKGESLDECINENCEMYGKPVY